MKLSTLKTHIGNILFDYPEFKHLEIDVYFVKDNTRHRIDLRLTEDMTITFDILEKLSKIFRTRIVNVRHDSGYYYSSYTQQDSKTYLEVETTMFMETT